jgi:general secretion pathway protein K
MKTPLTKTVSSQFTDPSSPSTASLPLCFSSDQSGLALIMVLWILSILSVLALELGHAGRMELKIASNNKEETQSYYIARAGIQRGIAQILAQLEKESQVSQWDFSGEKRSLPFAHGTMEITVADESGRINLNSMDDVGLALALRQVLNSMGVESPLQDIVIDSILDWRDRDNLHRINGAEDNHYRSLRVPYEAKDGPLDSLEELLMVRGVTPEIFFGRSTPEAAGDNSERIGLRDVATVYPRLGGNQKPDVNLAPRKVLIALGTTEDEAESIARYRRDNQINGEDQLKAALGTSGLPPWVTHFAYAPSRRERAFQVEASGSVEGSSAKRLVRATVAIRGGNPLLFRIVRWTDRVRNAKGTW